MVHLVNMRTDGNTTSLLVKEATKLTPVFHMHILVIFSQNYVTTVIFFSKKSDFRRILAIYLYVNGVRYKYFYTRSCEYSIKTWEIKTRARGRSGRIQLYPRFPIEIYFPLEYMEQVGV